MSVERGGVSVFLGRRCDTFPSSGFVDDVVFSRNRGPAQSTQKGVDSERLSRWRHVGFDTATSIQNDSPKDSTDAGAKSDVYNCVVVGIRTSAHR